MMMIEDNYHGLVIDMLEIKPEIPNFIVDLIGKKLLFTVIVDNSEMAQKVIRINKKIWKN